MMFTKKKGSNKKIGLCKPKLSGDMTIYNAEVLKQDLDTIINDYQCFKFDLSMVEEIDTSGVQILMAFAQSVRAQGKEFLIEERNEEITNALARYQLIPLLCEETE